MVFLIPLYVRMSDCSDIRKQQLHCISFSRQNTTRVKKKREAHVPNICFEHKLCVKNIKKKLKIFPTGASVSKWYPEQPQKCRCFSQAQKKGKMRTEIGRLNSGSILSLGCLILGACFQPNLGSETAVAATAAQHVAMHSAACGLEFFNNSISSRTKGTSLFEPCD